MFLVSDVARQLLNGNPRYLVGMSGAELVDRVVDTSGRAISDVNDGSHTPI